MKKVVLTSPSVLERGGLQAFLKNWINCNYNESIKYIWYLPHGIKDREYAKEFENFGVELYAEMPEQQKFKLIFKIMQDISQIIKNNVDIVHINTGSILYAALTAFIAKCYKISIIIIHSHSAGGLVNKSRIKKIIYTICRFFINLCATKKAACSKLAAEALFGKKYAKDAIIIPNYIDTKKFAFSEESRNDIRKRYGLEECFVIGQVARLSPEKNQKFLIDIFECVFKNDNSARLLLVGGGPLEDELKGYAKEKKLEDHIIFTGAADNPQDYYNIMDVFVLPSLFEGLPITGIEAQASGLPCVFSDTITQEVQLTDNCKFVSLNDSVKTWADLIMKYKNYNIDRNNAWEIITNSNYDVSSIGKMIKKLYEI